MKQVCKYCGKDVPLKHYWCGIECIKAFHKEDCNEAQDMSKNFTQEEWEKFHEEGNETLYSMNFAEADIIAKNTLALQDIVDKMKAEDGKQKPSLAGLPAEVLEQVAEVMSFGASKYYKDKWLLEPTCSFKRVDSALRHINKWLQGIDLDDESGKNHLDHAITQLMMAKEYINRGIDDGRWN